MMTQITEFCKVNKMSPINTIILAGIVRGLPNWKIIALLNQARFESGNFNLKLNSVYTASGGTNFWGMQYTKRAPKKVFYGHTYWSVYNSFIQSAFDRINWDNLSNSTKNAKDLDSYIVEVGKRGYWHAKIDKGYEITWRKFIEQHKAEDELRILTWKSLITVGLVGLFQ